MTRLPFTLDGTDPGSAARATRFQTLHGEVRTPVFMPVGTQATVKSQTVETLKTAGSSVLLANTYHLLLRPGQEVFERLGGIHRFMAWDGPVLTDSGGFQIFSLPHSRAMTEEGAAFQSYVDGTTKLLSPEASIAMQRAIGSDIMMVLDQCVPSTADHATALAAMELTTRWAKRSLAARQDSPQALFGIVQGACWPELRKRSAAELLPLDFDGYAIGGLAVGEGRQERDDFTELSASLLPRNKPRYLMGVGTPRDILEAVHRGVDMFDCILPLEHAQRGGAFTSRGKLQLRRGVYKFADKALDPACPCPTCATYSRAYLHHLTKADEVLGWTLIGQHNLWFYHRLMARMRQEILGGTWGAFYRQAREDLDRDDEDNPPQGKTRLPRDERVKRRGDYELRKSPHGPWYQVVQRSSGEAMHSVSDPAEEARRLYVDQVDLAGRLGLRPGKSQGPLVVWDVGLGAASNAMAVIRAAEALDPTTRRPLHLASFEQDLDPLWLAVRHGGRMPHLHHPGPAAILARGKWRNATEDEGPDCTPGSICWDLIHGDFRQAWSVALGGIPDLVLYDPFSFKTDGPLWETSLFAALRAAWERQDQAPTLLVTYSASTMVRSRLLAAGFWVGAGVATGPKASTTLAWAGDPGPTERPEAGGRLLGADWLTRRRVSHARWPEGLEPSAQQAWDSLIEGHGQFQA